MGLKRLLIKPVNYSGQVVTRTPQINHTVHTVHTVRNAHSGCMWHRKRRQKKFLLIAINREVQFQIQKIHLILRNIHGFLSVFEVQNLDKSTNDLAFAISDSEIQTAVSMRFCIQFSANSDSEFQRAKCLSSS